MLYQIYSITDSDLCLVGTAEMSIAGMKRGYTFAEEVRLLFAHTPYPQPTTHCHLSTRVLASHAQELPCKYVAFGHSFRREAGGGGRTSGGLYRLHQFSKVSAQREALWRST